MRGWAAADGTPFTGGAGFRIADGIARMTGAAAAGLELLHPRAILVKST